MRFSNSNVQPPPLDCNGYVIGPRTESNRTADGNRSGGGRNPIGQRTKTDWVADGIRSGGECLQGGALVSSAPTKLSSTQQSYQVPNKAIKYPIKLSSVQQSYQVPNKTVKCTNFLSVVNILAWMVHLRQEHPLKKTQRNRNNIAAGHMVMSSGYTLLYIVPSGGGTCLKCTNFLSVVNILARLVHLRQVHPLNLLYYLLASNDVDALAKC